MQTRWDSDSFTASLENLVWTASPVVRRYLHRLASGDPGCDWLTYAEWHHLGPSLDRALVLGCGSGWLERAEIVALRAATEGSGVEHSRRQKMFVLNRIAASSGGQRFRFLSAL